MTNSWAVIYPTGSPTSIVFLSFKKIERMAIVKNYTKDDLTVVWKPDVCIHSEVCFKGLPRVFNPKKRPWVNMEGEVVEKIREQVMKCPSGALSIGGTESGSGPSNSGVDVEVAKDGPLMVTGSLSIKLPDGNEVERQKLTAFCRCGASGNKPFCDGSHKKIDFKG